mmetsp:Transcript_9861/g.9697  ORF Transcript_9861/g.9697 Transcript_9861/m.9697 type:complete len:164 (+) Transcript_9861:1142-1633(+)
MPLIDRRRQRFNKIDNLEPIRPTRSKYKTPKRSNGQNVSTSYSQICNEASTTQYKSNAKPSEYSKKKILSRLGEMRMREKPFENATIHSHKNNLYLNEFSNISDLRKVRKQLKMTPFGVNFHLDLGSLNIFCKISIIWLLFEILYYNIGKINIKQQSFIQLSD